MWKRLVTFAAVALPLLGLLGYGFTRDARDIPSPLIGRPAPPFTVTLLDGGVVSLDGLRGKVVFINFWASWCMPCREEARMLEAAWQKYRDQDVVFVGVAIQDKEEDARQFVRDFGVTYPNARDATGTVAIDYGVWGIPETFVIDRTGRITYKHVGALGWRTVTARLDDRLRGVATAAEGRGDYRGIR